MKYIIFIIICLVTMTLEAVHYQSAVSITPLLSSNDSPNQTQEYLADIQIEKVFDNHAPVEIIAAPKLVCVEGSPAHLILESADKADVLSIEVMIPRGEEREVKTSIMLKEHSQVVLSSESTMKLCP